MRQIFKFSIAVTAAVILAASCEKDNGNDNQKTTAILTFEGESWDALIDSPQYGGPLLYGDMVTGTDYSWYDQGNTELASELCESNGSTIYWNGGHAVQQLLRTQRI